MRPITRRVRSSGNQRSRPDDQTGICPLPPAWQLNREFPLGEIAGFYRFEDIAAVSLDQAPEI
jgi:hypothetical protein